MSEFNAEEFSKSLDQLMSAEAVDEAFATVFALSPAEREAVGEILERDTLQEIEASGIKDEVFEKGTTAAKKSLEEFDVVDAHNNILKGLEAIHRGQAAIQAIYNITELKGDKTSPLLKAFVAAAEKLSDEKYNSEECTIEPLHALIDAVAKSEGLLTPNPLRNRNTPQPK